MFGRRVSTSAQTRTNQWHSDLVGNFTQSLPINIAFMWLLVNAGLPSAVLSNIGVPEIVNTIVHLLLWFANNSYVTYIALKCSIFAFQWFSTRSHRFHLTPVDSIAHAQRGLSVKLSCRLNNQPWLLMECVRFCLSMQPNDKFIQSCKWISN